MKPNRNLLSWLSTSFSSRSQISRTPKVIVVCCTTMGCAQLHGADILWNGGTGTYNNSPSWVGGMIPMVNDFATISNGGTVQLLSTDPNWTVNDLRVNDGFATLAGPKLNLNAWMRLGMDATKTGNVTMSNGLVDVPNGNIVVGEIGTGVFNMSAGIVNQRGGFTKIGNRSEGPNITGIGTLNMTGGSWNTTGEFWVAQGSTASDVCGTVNFTNASLNMSNWFNIGREGGDGEFFFNSGTISKSQEITGNQFTIADGSGSSGYLKQQGGTLSVSSELWIGQGTGSTGVYELSAGLIESTNWIAVGRQAGTGTLNMTGGTIRKKPSGANQTMTLTGTGTVNQTGGLVDLQSGNLLIAEFGASTAVYNLGGTGIVQAPETILILGNDGGNTATLNLNAGGVLKTGRLARDGVNGSSTATANFDGGSLVATRNQTNFISALNVAELKAGGLNLNTASFNVTTSQVFSGPGNLVKSGRGRLSLSSPTPINQIYVDAGELKVDANITTTAVNLANNTAISGVGTITGDINFGSGAGGAVLLVDSTVPGAISVSGNLNLNISRVDFSNANVPIGTPITVANFSGATSGSFILGRPGATAGGAGSFSVTLGAARTLDWSGSINSIWDVYATNNWLNGASPDKFGQGDTVNLGNSAGASPITIQGAIRPAAVAVSNTNTITLQGTAADDIAGSVVLTKAGAGKLIVDLDTSLNANQVTPTPIPSTVTISAGELQLGNGGGLGSLGLAAITNNGILSFNQNADKIIPNPISGTTGSLAKSGTGNTILTGATTPTSGTTTINSGRLSFQYPAIPGSGLITNNSELSIDNRTGPVVNISSVISGNGKLLKSGNNEVTLGGANTFTGDVEITQGAVNSLSITHAQALGTAAGKTIVRGGEGANGQHISIRTLTGGGTTIAEPFEFEANAFGRAGLRHEGGSQVLTLTGPMVVNSTAMSPVNITNVDAGSTLNIQGNITGTMHGSPLVFRGASAPINVSGGINISDFAELTLADASVVRLGAVGKTYQGVRANIANGQLTTLLNNTLPADQPVSMGQAVSSFTKWVLGTGASPVTQTVSALVGFPSPATSGIVGGATAISTLTVNQDSNTAFNVPIGGSAASENNIALIKSGKGNLTLNATNTFTGTTLVSGGTLTVNGSNTGSACTVQAGATLTGAGTMKSLVISGSAGNLANISPGNNGIGNLGFSTNSTIGANVAINWQVQDWTGSADKIVIVGNVNLTTATPLTIRLSNLGPLTNFTEVSKSFQLFQTFGITGFNAANIVIDSSGLTEPTGTWSVSRTGGNMFLNYSPPSLGGSYATWATAAGIPGALPNNDADNDGLANLVEYGLGTNPTTPNGSAGTFAAGTVTYNKGATAVANGDVTYSIESSPTLGVAPSPWVAVTPTTNTASAISYTLPTGQPRVFTRLVVTKTTP